MGAFVPPWRWNKGSARSKNLDYFDSYHRRASRGVYISWTGREAELAGRSRRVERKKERSFGGCGVDKPAKNEHRLASAQMICKG
jgi:hypothetical protein